jgi:hypothetical protein
MPKPTERIMDWLASNGLVNQVMGKEGDVTTKDNLREEMKAYAADLVGPNPTPLERTLADVAST